MGILRFWAVFALMILPIAAENIPGDRPYSPEDFKIELTASLWDMDTSGTVHTHLTMLDFVNNLGIAQNAHIYDVRLVYKPGWRHRIIVEGLPFRLDGERTSTETFTIQGHRFSIDQPLSTKGDLNVIYGGYEYDFIEETVGHIGVTVGGAYLDGNGSITDLVTKTQYARADQAALPLAGVDFRFFLIPGVGLVDVNGDFRGIDLGPLGYLIEWNVNSGIWIKNHAGLHVGYRDVSASLHDGSYRSLEGKVNGPFLSVSFKW